MHHVEKITDWLIERGFKEITHTNDGIRVQAGFDGMVLGNTPVYAVFQNPGKSFELTLVFLPRQGRAWKLRKAYDFSNAPFSPRDVTNEARATMRRISD